MDNNSNGPLGGLLNMTQNVEVSPQTTFRLVLVLAFASLLVGLIIKAVVKS